MKTRVVKEILDDYSIRFVPQYKVLWWWCNYSWGIFGKVHFDGPTAAKQFIKDREPVKVISRTVVE